MPELNPFSEYGIVQKFINHQPVIFQGLGDSTMEGAGDELHLDGWIGRFGVGVGDRYDCNVKVSHYNGENYGTVRTRRTGAGSELLVRNGGVSGSFLYQQLQTYYPACVPSTPDIFFIASAYNDRTIAGLTDVTFPPVMNSFIDRIQADHPGVPIVVTTENPFNGFSGISVAVALIGMTNNLVGQSLPLSPALVQSHSQDDVWVLDTRQALGNIWQGALYLDDKHLNAAGNLQLASWMVDTFFSAQAPIIVTTELDPIIRGVPFNQQILSVGASLTWSIVEGNLPNGLDLDEVNGIISGNATQFGVAYSFKLRATNITGHYDQEFDGLVDPNALPFVPTTIAPMEWLAEDGQWYAATFEVKHDDGSWIPATLEC